MLSDHSISGALNILVAEDNATNQLVIKKMLNLLGVHSTLVDNGSEAIKAFRMTLQDDYLSPFHMILMDINMPICDGLQASRAIRLIERKNGCQEPVTIVALSAQSVAEARQLVQQAGMDAFISKPVSLAELRVRLDSIALKIAPKKAEKPRLDFMIRNAVTSSASPS